jgi:hypothetical protein
MPANVQQAFARGVTALFADKAQKCRDHEGNVFKAWNDFAAKFPKLYEFAQSTKRARGLEEKLMLFHNLNPRSEKDREALAFKFLSRMENEESNNLEGALENWWKELTHD